MLKLCDTLIPQIFPSASASGVLTSANTGAFTTTKVVVIGSVTYTFVDALSTGPTVPYEVLNDVSADVALGNLVKAINGTGVEGTDYSVGTVKSTTVSAGAVTAHATTITAINPGFTANSYATTTDESKLSWGAATLVGGVGGPLSAVEVGGSTLTAYTDAMDVGSYYELLGFLNVTSHSGTNPTLDVTQQISADGVTWTDGDTFTQVTTGDTQTIKRFTLNFGKFMRLKVVLGGTAPRYGLSLLIAAKS
jgi:hypothetical protein